jgi:hypothetical protein
VNIIRWNVDRGPKEKRFVRKPAPLILALLGLSAAHASPPCQGMADKVTKEFDAERTMSNVDRPAKCKALYQVISDLTDLAVACGADRKFIDETYMPLAKSIGEEGPKACQ